MKVFTIEHDGMYLGGYSVVVAPSEEDATKMIREKLISMKLDPDRHFAIKEIDITKSEVHVLWNGDY